MDPLEASVWTDLGAVFPEFFCTLWFPHEVLSLLGSQEADPVTMASPIRPFTSLVTLQGQVSVPVQAPITDRVFLMEALSLWEAG